MRRRLFVLGILVTLTFSLHAQKLRDSVTVEVVDVPVYVSRGGVPVEGLTRDDFELYINGQRQSIDYFDVVSPAAEPTLRERRLFLLVFDIAFSGPHALVRAQKAASRLIDSAPASDLFAIATYAGKGIQFAVPFSADRVALQRAVARLKTSASGDPLAIVMTPAERSGIEHLSTLSRADRAEALVGSMDVSEDLLNAFYREMRLFQSRRRAEKQIDALDSSASGWSHSRGRSTSSS